MAGDEGRQVITYRIPIIETYEVTDDELERIKESCSSVSQDLTFAVSSLSICITLLASLLSGVFSQTVQTLFLVVVVVSAVVGVYTGFKWHRAKTVTDSTIAKIRSRKVDPPTLQQLARLRLSIKQHVRSLANRRHVAPELGMRGLAKKHVDPGGRVTPRRGVRYGIRQLQIAALLPKGFHEHLRVAMTNSVCNSGRDSTRPPGPATDRYRTENPRRRRPSAGRR